MDKMIQSCADEAVKELDKVFQQGYDLAFDKFNLVTDHEFRVAVTRPGDLSDDDDEEG